MSTKQIPIIDLFAGPGGLGEGFSSVVDKNNNRIFKIALSIECDAHAHETLTLRSFLRQFPYKQIPQEYYDFIKGKMTLPELYDSYPKKYSDAREEAWLATLGKTPTNEIDDRISKGLKEKKNWVLIGGPPCQAFSNAGRSRVGGISSDDHRVFLYKEYLRIIAKHQPAVFVMENVKGLLSSKLENHITKKEEKVFHWMLTDLQNPNSVFREMNCPKYKIYSLAKEGIKKDSDYLIRSEDYGIPQKRHRVILLGIREDIKQKPSTLIKSDQINLESIIGMLPALRSGISRTFTHTEETLTKDGKIKKRRCYRKETDSYDNWSKIIQTFRKELKNYFKLSSDKPNYPESIGKEYATNKFPTIRQNHKLKSWYIDSKLNGIIHHVSRKHLMQDLKRYLFASLYTLKNKKFPKLEDYKKFDKALLPDHDNVDSGKFTDRFKVQLPNEPCATVTSHISKDGHYFIHYDPLQCRSLTVREAARIQTFPDNYLFCGPRTEQFHQVGNAVPPLLAKQIAEVVKKLF